MDVSYFLVEAQFWKKYISTSSILHLSIIDKLFLHLTRRFHIGLIPQLLFTQAHRRRRLYVGDSLSRLEM